MKKFDEIKNAILGKSYDLSLAFVSPAISKKLNRTYRGIDKPTNILSFNLSKNSGEIILCREQAMRDARSFGKTYRQFLGHLVIHGLLHLKGMQHSSKMEVMEKKFCQKFNF